MCVITAYGVLCLVDGCRWSGAGQQVVCPGRMMLVFLLYASVLILNSSDILG